MPHYSGVAGFVQQCSAAGCSDGDPAGLVPGGLAQRKGERYATVRVHAHKTGTSETAKLVLSHDTLKMLRVWEVRDKVAEESPLLFPDYKGAEISHLTTGEALCRHQTPHSSEATHDATNSSSSHLSFTYSF